VDRTKLLRKLPQIDRVLKTAKAQELKKRWLPRLVDGEVRALVEELRETMRNGEDAGDLAPEAVAERAGARLAARLQPGVVRCVNATGVILHTGLGRAAFAPEVVEALRREVAGYCVVSVDRQEGQRIRRETAAARMLCALSGAEAATVVNNNAGATLIALSTLAAGREVVVSRGQLVEIGGSFRMPDVFKAAGVVLREVGTTNRTHRRDYAEAIGPATGLLLRVHPSNYRISGFTSEVPLAELVELGKAAGLPVMDDLGAGALVPVPPEPEVAASLALGVDLLTCSGDKLIGGPQCGILLGKLEWIDRIRKNPLFRALRVDKMTLCALEATLKLFLAPDGPGDSHPTLRMLRAPAQALKRRAAALRSRLKREAPRLETELRAGFSEVGSGSLPGESLVTTLVSIRHPTLSAAAFARMLRFGDPPVYARIVDDLVCVDPRTLLDGDDRLLVRAMKEVS